MSLKKKKKNCYTLFAHFFLSILFRNVFNFFFRTVGFSVYCVALFLLVIRELANGRCYYVLEKSDKIRMVVHASISWFYVIVHKENIKGTTGLECMCATYITCLYWVSKSDLSVMLLLRCILYIECIDLSQCLISLRWPSGLTGLKTPITVFNPHKFKTFLVQLQHELSGNSLTS